MNRIMLTCLLLAATGAFGQGRGNVNKKPDVTLSGDPSAPTINNNSDRHIIAYQIYWNGSVAGYGAMHFPFSEIRQGKPPDIPAHSKRLVVRPDSQTQVTNRDGGDNRIIGAQLLSVIFDDGELVGINASEAMLDQAADQLSERINAEKDLHGKLLRALEKADRLVDKTAGKREKDAAWLEATSSQGKGRAARFAEELARMRAASGDAAAIELAKGSQKYPKIWRKK